ncbi:MAG: hypothetical protein ACXW1N_08385 [Halobacteriota archaeon]
MATCRHDGCSEAVCGDFAWCILHLDFLKGNDPEFTRIRDEKLLKTKEKIKAGDLNFEGTNIYDVDASDVSIPGRNNAIFKNATIKGRVRFEKTKIETSVWFEGAQIRRTLNLI